MRLRPVPLAVLLTAVLAAPAFAVSTWYDYYLDARNKHIPAKRWKEGLASLQEAVRLKPDSAINEQTYGLSFEHYFPYYYQGVCYLGMGDYNSAIRMFNIEEKNGAIRRLDAEYRELLKRRNEARDAQTHLDKAAQVRKLKETIDQLVLQAVDLQKAGKYVEALAKLNETQGQKVAELLDPATQAEIQGLMQKVREDKDRAEKAQERRRRLEKIEKDLAEGTRMLEGGNPSGAKLRFESVLDLDPAHAAALAGKVRAEDEIRASTTKAERENELRRGRALVEAGKYEESLRPLAAAAADPSLTEAQQLLDRARKYVEGVRKEKDKRIRLEGLLTEAEELLAKRKYADAWVRLESALEIDPSNGKAQERLRVAQRLTGEDTMNRFFPNEPPSLTFMTPRGTGSVITADSPGDRFDVWGVAWDDRGLARLRFFLRGEVVGDQEMVSNPKTGDLPRNVHIERTFTLDKGPNEIKVIAIDSLGATHEQAFHVTRTLQIHERPWFLPSAAGTAVGLVGLGFAVQRSRRRRAVRSRFNPYIAGAPVLDEDMFFGRQKLLARILNVLHHNSLMITGERRIGKTTLLHHLKLALEKDEGTDYQFFPISTDLQGVPESGFFHAVMSDVVEGVRPEPERLAGLRFSPEGEDYDGRDFSHDLQRIVEELKGRTPKKVKLALLIDEVDVLNEYSERVNQRLRSIFMKTFSEHLVAIMSGVGIKRIWKSEGSPWYNFFDEIELTALSHEEAEALIREPVEGIFRYEPEAVELILCYSSLKPYVIQKFCIHAVNRMLEDGRSTVTTADVETVRDTVQFERPEEAVEMADRASA